MNAIEICTVAETIYPQYLHLFTRLIETRDKYACKVLDGAANNAIKYLKNGDEKAWYLWVSEITPMWFADYMMSQNPTVRDLNTLLGVLAVKLFPKKSRKVFGDLLGIPDYHLADDLTRKEMDRIIWFAVMHRYLTRHVMMCDQVIDLGTATDQLMNVIDPR